MLTSQYSEGELDWYDFDAKPGLSLGAAADRVAGSNPVSIARTVIPAPVTYRGMPASRWWEFEDASVDFGSVDAEPDDLARMLLVEFAITYGNDWFVIPIDIPVGSVCKIQSIVLTDTFGVRTLIPSIAAATHPTAAAWSMFRNTSGAGDLFLAPTLPRKIEGKPLDDVLFLRDEMANMAWGVERIAEGISGRPLNRREEDLAQQQRSAPPAAAAASADDVLTWKLSTEVPGYWIPLVPVQISAESGAIRFRRGTTLRPDGTHTTTTGAQPDSAPERRPARHLRRRNSARRRPCNALLSVCALARRQAVALDREEENHRARRGLKRSALRSGGVAALA